MKQLHINRKAGKIIYLLLFVAMAVALLINDGLKDLNKTSSLGLPYWIVFLLVLLPLLYQAILNNKIGWSIIVVLVIAHLFLTVRNLINNESFSNIIVVIAFYLLAFFFLLLLYPRRRLSN